MPPLASEERRPREPISIGEETTAGVIQQFPVGVVSWRITPGPDGNLWFAENESSGVGRITPTGTAKSFPVPTQNSNVNGIALGPNGTVWFTEQGTDKIGRLTVCASGDATPGDAGSD